MSLRFSRGDSLRYLQAMLGQGVDVIYLATGERPGLANKELHAPALRAVSVVLVDWLATTGRNLSPELLEEVIGLLYSVALMKVSADEKDTSGVERDELIELLSKQMRLVG